MSEINSSHFLVLKDSSIKVLLVYYCWYRKVASSRLFISLPKPTLRDVCLILCSYHFSLRIPWTFLLSCAIILFQSKKEVSFEFFISYSSFRFVNFIFFTLFYFFDILIFYSSWSVKNALSLAKQNMTIFAIFVTPLDTVEYLILTLWIEMNFVYTVSFP